MLITLNGTSPSHEPCAQQPAPVKLRRPLARGVGVAGLFLLSAACLAVAGLRDAFGQAAAPKEGAAAAPARWLILFRSADPALWDTSTKGVAIPVRYAPAAMRYLRLRRMDTGEALILPLTRDQLRNGKVPTPETGSWWNGTAKEEWKGRHLGIAEGPRYKFPNHKDVISVMNKGWDAFSGSGFGHKCHANDVQYYSWRGQELSRTVFEIAVSEGPLSPDERRSLVARP